MILIKDRGNHTYVFCNVELIMHENENHNGYLTIKDMVEHKLLYKWFTDSIKEDGIKLIETIDIDDTLGELLKDE